MRKFLFAIGLLALSAPAWSAVVPCDSGQAGAYPCSRVDMLAHLTQDQLGGASLGNLNDMWGWVDDMGTPNDPSDDRAYALVGRETALVFVDITDSTNPVYLGKLPDYSEEIGGCPSSGKQAKHEDSSPWRDVKTYSHYAFVVSEAPCEGMQVFDLYNLRGLTGASPLTFSEDAHYTNFGNAHNLFIDQQRGYAYVVGSDTYAGGPHIIDVTNPLNPVKRGGYDGDGYTHDIQCVDYTGPDSQYANREICFASNEDTLTILDVTDPANVQQISRNRYDHPGYAHQGWLTSDQKYFYFDDEQDEANYGTPTRTLVWDLSELGSPTVAETYFGQTHAIDHNQYLSGRFDYQANYTSGLRILDTHSPTAPFEVGYFDTHPNSDDAVFQGAWTAYPFFPSGVTAISDIENGLFLVKPTFAAGFSNNADLSVDVSVDSNSQAAYSHFPYTVTVTNNGPDDVTDVQFSMNAANHLTFVSGSLSNSADCTRDSDSRVTCRFASLAAGDTRQFTVDGTSDYLSRALGVNAMVSANAKDDKGNNNTTIAAVTIYDPSSNDSGGGAFGMLMLGGLFGLALLRLKRCS